MISQPSTDSQSSKMKTTDIISEDEGPYLWLEPDGTLMFKHNCDIGLNLHSLPRCIWQVTQEFPLSISPSIKCGYCGAHGWYREGVWVPV